MCYTSSTSRATHYTYFKNLCVARCRHDYELRTSLAKAVEGQMSIVVQLPDVSTLYICVYKSPCTFDLPLMKALDWDETSGNCVTIDICPATSTASDVLSS